MSGVEPIAKRRLPDTLTLTARRTPVEGEVLDVKPAKRRVSAPSVKMLARSSALALLGMAFAFAQPTDTGHLDAGHLLGLSGPGSERWQTFLMASPAGSIHEATVYVDNDQAGHSALSDLAQAGVGRLFGEGVRRAAIAPQAGPDDLITGSIPSQTLPSGPDPLVARDRRQHRALTPAVHALVEARRVPTSLYNPHPFAGVELASLPREGFEGHVGMIPPPPQIIIAGEGSDRTAVPADGADGAPSSTYAMALVDPSAATSPLSDTEGQQQISAFLGNDRQFQCLAEGIYFEARGEPRRGQVAVAQVIMNRVNHDEFPDTICGVVYQNQHWRNRCQFSFACDGVPERVSERGAWEVAEGVARQVLERRDLIETIEESTHYHATYVRPRWAPRMIRLDRVGLHIFYKGRYGGWR